MAHTLDRFPISNSRFAWDQWLDGQVWELLAGDDFDASKPATFRRNARVQAKERGGDVRTQLLEREGREVIVLQFVRGPVLEPHAVAPRPNDDPLRAAAGRTRGASDPKRN
jgi:hypothetical protein